MLEIERLILRIPEPEDLERLYEWENDLDLFPHKDDLSFYSKAQLEQYIIASSSSLHDSGQQRFMIDDKLGNTIGAVDLFDFNALHERAGVGVLVDKQYRRKGFANEALTEIKNYGFKKLHLRQLFCDISLANKASIRLFENLGFVQTGIKKAWLKKDSTFQDVGLYQCLNPQL
jgi:diamine N-acetyltransferase